MSSISSLLHMLLLLSMAALLFAAEPATQTRTFGLLGGRFRPFGGMGGMGMGSGYGYPGYGGYGMGGGYGYPMYPVSHSILPLLMVLVLNLCVLLTSGHGWYGRILWLRSTMCIPSPIQTATRGPGGDEDQLTDRLTDQLIRLTDHLLILHN